MAVSLWTCHRRVGVKILLISFPQLLVLNSPHFIMSLNQSLGRFPATSCGTVEMLPKRQPVLWQFLNESHTVLVISWKRDYGDVDCAGP